MAVSSQVSGVAQFSFVLSGLAGVGKTAIFNHLKKLAGSPETTEPASGGGIDCCIYSTVVRGLKCKISIFDTGGLERYASLTSNYYHRCNGVILVYLNDPDRLDTLTCLNLSIESALSYNKSPDMLVFSLWGNSFNDERDPMTESIASLQEHVSALLENTSIPKKLHFIVNPMTGRGIKEAIDGLVVAVQARCRDKSDSVLSPSEAILTSIDSAESLDDATSPLQLNVEEERKREGGRGGKASSGKGGPKKKCCLSTS